MDKLMTYTGNLQEAGILSARAWVPIFKLVNSAGGADTSFVVLLSDTGYVHLNSETLTPVTVRGEFKVDQEPYTGANRQLPLSSLPAGLLSKTAGTVLIAPVRDTYGVTFGFMGSCHDSPIAAGDEPEDVLENACHVAATLCRSFLPLQMEGMDAENELMRQALLDLQEEMDSARGQLDAFLDSVPSAIVVTDENGDIIRHNAQAASTFADSGCQLNSLNVSDLLQHVADNGEPSQDSHSVAKRRSGEIFPVVVSSTTLELNPGVTETIYVITDVSTFVEMQAEAQQARDETEQLIHRVHVPILTIDMNGFIRSCNADASALLALSAEQLVGEHFERRFMRPTDVKLAQPMFDRLDAGEDLSSLELKIVTATGEERQLLVSVTIRRDAEGKAVERVAIGQDITEIRMKETLLRQSHKMETIGQLTSGIAHDFNNLLNILTGNLRYLESLPNANSDYAEVVEDSLSAASDAAELISRLLAFSREDFGDKAKEILISEAVEKVQKVTQRSFRKDVRLHLGSVDPSLVVFTDPVWFENSLINLVNNARDAMAETGGTAVISAEEVWMEPVAAFGLRAGQYARVSVEDSGPGIPESLRDRVFDPFFSTKAKEDGTGLGLAMVFRFCQRAGGFCEVDKSCEQGARINLYLPVKINDTAALGELPSSDLSDASRRVLVVEDDDRVRRVIVRDLKAIGMTCVESSSADDAIQILAADNNFSLVMSDVMMPGQADGFDLAEWVAERYPELPVLLASAYTGKPGLRAAGADFIAKPYEFSELERRVRNLTAERNLQTYD